MWKQSLRYFVLRIIPLNLCFTANMTPQEGTSKTAATICDKDDSDDGDYGSPKSMGVLKLQQREGLAPNRLSSRRHRAPC